MRKWLKVVGILLAVLLTGVLLCSGWYLLLDGRAPGRRPDLIVLPEDAPKPPAGYPTENALMLSFLMDRVTLLETEGVETPSDVVETLDIEYGSTPEQKLLLDLYSPSNLNAPTPGLIFIHGGGWYKGDRKDYKLYTIPFAQKGYVVASISYRFTTVAPFPAQVEDTKCAIRWMRKHAEELNVDPDRIAVIGGSAGGYLSLMAGLTGDDERFEGTGGHEGVSSAVKAVVDIYGPVDLTTPFAQTHDTITRFLKKPYAGNERLYELASPINHVDTSDTPILIIQGTIDSLVKVTQSDLLAEKLQAEGMPYWYDRLDGWPHTMDRAEPVYERCFWMMNRFFDTYL